MPRTWSDIAQHSQESLQSPSSPRTPAFRIRTPTSPPALQKREDLEPLGAVSPSFANTFRYHVSTYHIVCNAYIYHI